MITNPGFSTLCFFLLSLVLVVVSTVSAENCSSNGPTNTYNATAFYETVSYRMSSSNGYAFSPDGLYILITSDQNGVFNAYALPINMNSTTNSSSIENNSIIALTNSTTNAISAISYFPSDSRILYSADEGGNELDHIYVRDDRNDNGIVDIQDLTPGNETKAMFAGWRRADNDDGSMGDSFFIFTNERNASFFDVYEYSIDDNGYERTLLFQNDLELDISSISPDGRWLASVQRRTSADSNILLVDLSLFEEDEEKNHTAILITQHDEGNDINHGVYTFTPDSLALVYSTNEFGEFNQAWIYNLTSGGDDDNSKTKTPLVQADWDVVGVGYSPSGRYRITVVNADAITELSIVDTTTTNEQLKLPIDELPAGEFGQIRFSPNEDILAFVINSDTSPSDIFVISLVDDDSSVQQLTSALNPDICQNDLVDGQVIRYKSFDSLEIPSILYKPKNATANNKVPALVWVHGGPGGQSSKGYDATKQHLLNHGYAILAANNRGSSGYGKTFFHMDDQQHGDVDLQDIVYGKKYLESLDWIDPNRIGIMGGSYGGYMTVAALAFEPEVFEVGIDIFGVTNWLRTLESIPAWWGPFRDALYDEMGDPATARDRLYSISPLFHADQIIKPLMVVQGANDPRVLQVESDEIVAALQNNSVPVEYLVFEDEGHGFQIKSNRIEASEAYLAFLVKYLTGTDTANITTTEPSDETDASTTTTSESSGVASLYSLCIWCFLLPMLNVVQMLSL